MPPSDPWQDRPEPQELSAPPPQQAAARLPHAVHVPPEQRVPEAVQVIGPPPPPSEVEPPQHTWLTFPQAVPVAVWQDPAVHIPLVPAPVQAPPLAVHIPASQQPPPLQALAAQQIWPEPPQATVVPPGPTLVVLPPPHAPATLSNNPRPKTVDHRLPLPVREGDTFISLSSLSTHWCTRRFARCHFLLRDEADDVTQTTSKRRAWSGELQPE